jgi:hypothetical protein
MFSLKAIWRLQVEKQPFAFGNPAALSSEGGRFRPEALRPNLSVGLPFRAKRTNPLSQWQKQFRCQKYN